MNNARWLKTPAEAGAQLVQSLFAPFRSAVAPAPLADDAAQGDVDVEAWTASFERGRGLPPFLISIAAARRCPAKGFARQTASADACENRETTVA